MIVQSILSLVIGIPIGYKLTLYTINEMNNDFITLYSRFEDIPVIFIIIFIVFVSIIGRLISSHNQIKLVDAD